jgi:hypothetical protein
LHRSAPLRGQDLHRRRAEEAQLWMQAERRNKGSAALNNGHFGRAGDTMRTFDLSTHVNSVSRGEGRSATAAAAYRACCAIDCEREGKTHDYSRKQGLEAAEIVLPPGAPEWANDRARLWNAAELVERNGKRGKNAGAFKTDAQTAREIFYSFPAELSAAGRLNAARTIARHLADTHGIAADFAIHQPGKDGDERNYHCHMLTTTRRLGPKGLGEKAREWGDLKTGAKLAKDTRAFIAAILNAELKAEGKAGMVHVEHRSFKDRGSSQKPQQHHGPGGTHALRKHQARERRAWFQEALRKQRDRHAKELASIKLRQDFALQGKLTELARRGREEVKAIKAELAAARRADTPPEGMRRIFLAVTGRAMREAFDRQARDGQRVMAARQKRDALKSELRAERSAYAAGQTQERAALIERHAGEDRQLRQALVSREGLDRAREVTARQPEQQTMEREREERGRSMGPELSP